MMANMFATVGRRTVGAIAIQIPGVPDGTLYRHPQVTALTGR